MRIQTYEQLISILFLTSHIIFIKIKGVQGITGIIHAEGDNKETRVKSSRHGQ